jgi:rhamnose utilization protein RhaD (predicted bifunctional aldolase and dehydrogenase)/NAD(P)-dependent dehydrogenase (short-subunit alcohol dehydrogenase family)
MNSLWDDAEASDLADDPLQIRVYTSRLLGRSPDLVLHGGGNTSVKASATDLFGDSIDTIYVKGSGWDLATIEPAGFAPVRLDALVRMAELDELSDSDMVRAQRGPMLDPNAPNPSIEAVLHAIIPFAFVDHTHADAVVAITNTADGEARIRAVYGERVIVVPYVMPGFILAKKVQELTRDIDWSRYDGMILMNHGVFTWGDAGKSSYERMIQLVTEAEEYLAAQGAKGTKFAATGEAAPLDPVALAQLRRDVSNARGSAVLAVPNNTPEAVGFSNLPEVAAIASRGPLTPDHVIRTKQTPMIHTGDSIADTNAYEKAYDAYFKAHDDGTLTRLDAAPRWAVWPGCGSVCFGRTLDEATIIDDITSHTVATIQMAESLGGWCPLPDQDIFDIEYWELEQAKLRKGGSTPPLLGKIALVTGAAGGIGLACVDALSSAGAVVAALDISETVGEVGQTRRGVVGLRCDMTSAGQVNEAVAATARAFGGIDIVVSNAGTFPPSAAIADMSDDTWNQSIAVNLSAHRSLMTACAPFLALGVDPAVVVVGSKNVPAPGRGAAAYSVAKAGLTQLARIAALELGDKGVRVNVVHPNNVFDTGIWTTEVLESRARHYGMTAEEYKANNVLGREVTSQDVAQLVLAMVGPAFAKTTGAQVPIDGGNDRVI